VVGFACFRVDFTGDVLRIDAGNLNAESVCTLHADLSHVMHKSISTDWENRKHLKVLDRAKGRARVNARIRLVYQEAAVKLLLLQ